MNLGLLGGIAGLGEGLAKVGDRWHENDIRAENARMEMEKEKRIEESKVAAEGRQENYQINAENRGIQNAKTMAQNKLDFDTNPQNLQKTIDAKKLADQAELDFQADPNNINKKMAFEKAKAALGTDEAIRLHNATDRTDYTGRKLQNELASLNLEQAKSIAKIPPAVKMQYDAFTSDIKDLHKENVNADPEVIEKNNKTIEYLSKQRLNTIKPYLDKETIAGLDEAANIENKKPQGVRNFFKEDVDSSPKITEVKNTDSGALGNINFDGDKIIEKEIVPKGVNVSQEQWDKISSKEKQALINESRRKNINSAVKNELSKLSKNAETRRNMNY